VKVTPHQLRHTYATQLVNAGCRITTLQALMGHRHLNTTLTYARVHNRTVAEDYYTAMAVVEKRLALPTNRPFKPTEENGKEPNQNAYPARQMLAMVETLQAEPLTESQRHIVTKLHSSLAALTESLSLNGTHNEFDSIVNERGMKLELSFP
jgi:hypothetical protein